MTLLKLTDFLNKPLIGLAGVVGCITSSNAEEFISHGDYVVGTIEIGLALTAFGIAGKYFLKGKKEYRDYLTRQEDVFKLNQKSSN